MTMSAVMGIDLGTTSVKCLAMDRNGKRIASASHSYPIQSPHTGWVEQRPEDWWAAVVKSVRECLSALPEDAFIEAVSLSGHMSALTLLDECGSPVMPAILIADTRSEQQTRYLMKHYRDRTIALTGNVPLDAFTAPKLMWVRDQRPDLYRKADKLVFPKDYVRFRLTGRLGTDPTDAGNSLLFDVRRREWNETFIRDLGLRVDLFPEAADSLSAAGTITSEVSVLTGLPAGTPVFTGAADIACTQIGTGTLEADIMAITLSTSAQIIMRVPDTHVGVAGQVTFHPSAAAAAMYAMGSVFTGGLGVQWGYELLFDRDSMNAGDYEQLERLSERMKQIPCGSGGLLFLPFLVGSSTPYFDPRDRAAWIGLTHHRDKALLLHSIMEGIAFNIRENVEAFAAMGQVPRRIYLGGGGSRNPVWRQMIADVLGREMVLLQTSDASALGAAAIAGVGAGLFDSLESISRELVREGERLDSDGERHRRYNVLYEKYRKVYRSLHEYYTELDSELLGE